MQSLWRICCLILCCLVLASCMKVGQNFPVAPVAKIELNQTSKADIRSWFGNPWRTGVEDGMKVWTYAEYHYGMSGQSLARDLVIRFHDNGTVKSYSFSSTVPGEGDVR